MNKPIKKILVILLLIIILPLGYLFYSQFTSIDEYEENIRNTYLSQLETILFSINQYSEDILRNWINQAETNRTELNKLFQQNNSLISFFDADTSLGTIKTVNSRVSAEKIKSIFEKSPQQLSRLISLRKNGYQKLDVFNYNDDNHEKLIVFVNSLNGFSGFLVDEKIFVSEKLEPKIQTITQNEFSVVVLNELDYLFPDNQKVNGKIEFKKNLWIFPELSIGIILNGKSVSDLAKEKRTSSLFILTLLFVILMVLSVLVFVNIKKELELIKIKSDFVANVSHELRTPLALINLYAETLFLGRINSEDKKSEYYKIIQQESERLSSMINKILNFSRMEGGKLKFNFTAKDLNQIVKKVFDSYEYHLRNKNFTLELILSEKQLLGLFDEEAITETLVNLIDNAVKYSAEKKEIQIKTGGEQNDIFFEIKDSGKGISKQNQNKIYDKFFRISESDIHNVKGTGIGLTIVKYIVEAHKGRIELVSKLNSGSTFKLIFPKLDEVK